MSEILVGDIRFDRRISRMNDGDDNDSKLLSKYQKINEKNKSDPTITA